jgi:hypothetical protein
LSDVTRKSHSQHRINRILIRCRDDLRAQIPAPVPDSASAATRPQLARFATFQRGAQSTMRSNCRPVHHAPLAFVRHRFTFF